MKPTITDTQKKAAKIAAIVGMVLALVCHALPPKYQTVCNLAAQIAPHAC